MAYSYDPIFAADPSNAANVAANAAILIFNPADTGKAPITITDVTGAALPNPITVNKNGFGPAFQHATLDRVGWFGAGFTGYFTSYEGMKAVATAAQAAAAASASAASNSTSSAAASAAAATAAAAAAAAATGGAAVIADPGHPGLYFITSGGSVTADPTFPGLYTIGA